jgi:6-phosphogluconolactonase
MNRMKKKKHILRACLVVISAMTLWNCTGPSAPAESILFFTGSSNGSLSSSIYLCKMDPVQETVAVVDSFSGARAASYLALSPREKYLYAINQDHHQDTLYASVTSFAIDPATHAIGPINSQSSKGSDICHIYCSKDGSYIFAANYGSGHAAAFPVEENGKIEPASSVVMGEGNGPVEGRQEGPHAHMVMLDPGQNYLLVPDLGADKVWIYAFDHDSGVLTPNPAQAFFSLSPGSGPRHLAFHPDGKSLYIVNELNSTITACTYNGSDGTISELNTISTVEDSHQGMKYPAAVRVHPNGRKVYASTRGENSCISTFEINEDRTVSRIQVMEHVPNWPRDFNLDPSGKYMLVAGERSDEIRLYKIDPAKGTLTETEGSIKLPAPASILFIQ